MTAQRTLAHFFTLLAFCGPILPGMAQDDEKPHQGLLWRISGNGTDGDSYLYGTMHVSDKLAYHLSEEFFEGIQDCDAVALETDPSRWMELMMGEDRFPSYTDLVSDRISYRNRMGRSFYEDAFHTEKPDRELLARSLSSDGSLTRRLLFRTNPMESGDFEESTYLDLFIFRAGKKADKPVHSLESFSTSNRMRFEARDMAKKKDERVMQRSIYFDGSQKRVGTLTREAYREGDLQRLDSIMRIAASDAFYEKMIVKRNRLMADNLDSLMQRKQVFTGVGSAHLPGKKGMIEILREKGYELEAIPRNFQKKSRKSKEAKERVEEEYMSRSYETRYAEDSLFRVDLPGPLFTVRELPSRKEYLHTDMVNGIFYRVRRIDTYHGLTGNSVSELNERIDSLLFENVPGEILERKRVRTDGHPGFHIKNETARGNIQEYRIVQTPLQLLIFKAGGTKDVLEGEPSENFFDSIRIRSLQDSSWSDHEPEQGGFRIRTPGTPLTYAPKTTDLSLEGRMELRSRDTATGDHYLLRKRTLHDHDYIEEDSFELHRLAEKFAEPLDLEIREEDPGSFRGYPSLDIQLGREGMDRELHARILIRGAEYYLLLASMRSEKDPDRFLDGFEFTDPKYRRSFRTYRDTAVPFSARTIAPDSVPEHSMAAFRRRSYERQNKGSSKHRWYDGKRKGVGHFTPAEKIQVRLIDFKDHAWARDSSNLWDFVLDRCFDDDLSLERSDHEAGPDSSECVFLHSDTNSQRAIRSRNIYHEGAVFSLRYVTDTTRSLSEESPYVKRFFKSFEPIRDSSFGPNLFENKVPLFFEAVRSGDSARMEKAERQFYILEFEGKQVDSLMSFIREMNGDGARRDIKAKAYQRLGWFHEHEGVIPFLKEAYDREEGDGRMRFAILEALARRGDTASKHAILELFERQVPLTNDPDHIWGFFNELDDSLELVRPMVPDILKYADFRAYERPIYELLAEAVDSGVVEGSDYRSYKGELLRYAKRRVRMHLASKADGEEGRTVSYRFNGRSYSYSREARGLKDEERKLLEMATLLAPFYEEDEEVQTFFERFQRTPSDALLMRGSLLGVRSGIPVEDSVWAHLAVQDPYRNMLLSRLEEMGRTDLFPEEFRDQRLLARGQLYPDIDPREDSVRFLERREVRVGKKEGFVYFFKSKGRYTNDWQLDYTGLHPLEENEFDFTPMFKEMGKGRVNERQELKERLDEEVEMIELRERERVGSESSLY